MSNTPTATKPTGSGAKVLLGGLLGALLAALVVVVLAVTGVVNVSLSRSADAHEGGGFDTPEQAAIAYVEAFRDQDLRAMQQAFAVESYAQACDYEAELEQLSTFMWSAALHSCPFPADDTVGAQANVELRQAAITQAVSYSFTRIVAPELGVDANGRMFNDDAEIRDFLHQVSQDFADYAPGRISNIQAIEPEQIYDGYTDERIRDIVQGTAEVLGIGGPDYVDVAVTFEMDGEEWVFMPAVGRYNDRWYLITPQGSLALLMGLAFQDGGFALREGV